MVGKPSKIYVKLVGITSRILELLHHVKLVSCTKCINHTDAQHSMYIIYSYEIL